MNKPVEGFRSVQKAAEYSTTMLDVVIHCLPQAVKRINGGAPFLEAKLKLRRCERIAKYSFQDVLKQLRQDWRNCDSSVVPGICQIAMEIFH